MGENEGGKMRDGRPKVTSESWRFLNEGGKL